MKPIRCFLCTLLVILSLSPSPPARAAEDSTRVYVTKTGECYHRGFCWHLRKSKIEIDLDEAVEEGYRPCKNCRPPQTASVSRPGSEEWEARRRELIKNDQAA